MKLRNRKLAVESLEGRAVMSATTFADFNNDGLLDMAAITASNTVTVSLAQIDGSFKVSAVLSAPKSQPIQDITAVSDINADGYVDLYGSGSKPSMKSWYTVMWLNNRDGTFKYIEPFKWKGVHPHASF